MPRTVLRYSGQPCPPLKTLLLRTMKRIDIEWQWIISVISGICDLFCMSNLHHNVVGCDVANQGTAPLMLPSSWLTITMIHNDSLSSKLLRWVKAPETWGFQICPGMLTASNPLVGTSLLGSDPSKTCYIPRAAQVQDTASSNKLSKWASTQSLTHLPT